jgi:hypothetical protein
LAREAGLKEGFEEGGHALSKAVGPWKMETNEALPVKTA